MPAASLIVQARQRRRFRQQQSPALKAGWGCAVALILGMVGLIFAAVWAAVDLGRDLPSLDALPLFLDGQQAQLLQPTRLMDRTGQKEILRLENPAAGQRRFLTIWEFSPTLITTTLATLDPGFWSSPGFTLAGLGAGLHATIAQRIVYDFLLWDEAPGLRRDLRERLLAAQLVARFGRQKALEWYLNSAAYGPGVYGAEAAAHIYLDRAVDELSWAEAAFLVAAAQSPAIDPLEASELVFERQRQILAEMRQQKWITSQQADHAQEEELRLQRSARAISLAPGFTELALAQLASQLPLVRIQRGGLRIITTLDFDLQQQTACATASLVKGSAVACEAARPLAALAVDLPAELDAAAAILDPHSGQILALTGDVSAPHPAGTLFTPYLYLSAFARGFSPAALVWDIPDQELSNFDQQSHGPMRLRMALANDYLPPASQVYQQVGDKDINRLLDAFGFSVEGDQENLAALLNQSTTPLTAAHALGVFANRGVLAGRAIEANARLQPTAILRVEATDGRLWLDWSEPQRRSLVSAQLAYLATHVLSDEPARWPSLGHPNLLEIGRPAAVKAGRTLSGRDAWTVGTIPQATAVVWIGLPEEVEGEAPIQAAAALWQAIIQSAARSRPALGWETPAGVNTVAVCDPSGLLPTVECPNVVSEIFLAGSEPTIPDTLYRAVPVNRETGLLATVFTPPSLVENRVYLLVPPEAAGWAAQAGLPVPPRDYDLIAAPLTSARVNLSQPALFANVRGQVTLRGSATAEDFRFYRLQVGAGLNPQRWLQVGEDNPRPVEDGVLGVWDASGLSGLYAIQLLVVHKDQTVETVVAQVTVDNQPPAARFLAPQTEGEKVDPDPQGYIPLQLTAEDDIGLWKVELEADGALLAAFYPSAAATATLEWKTLFAWQGAPGQHQLLLRVFDRAGNSSEKALSLEVRKRENP